MNQKKKRIWDKSKEYQQKFKTKCLFFRALNEKSTSNSQCRSFYNVSCVSSITITCCFSIKIILKMNISKHIASVFSIVCTLYVCCYYLENFQTNTTTKTNAYEKVYRH